MRIKSCVLTFHSHNSLVFAIFTAAALTVNLEICLFFCFFSTSGSSSEDSEGESGDR